MAAPTIPPNHFEVLSPQTQKESIKLLNQPNEGVSAARNLGLKATSGDFIGSLDSDDCAAPPSLAQLLSILMMASLIFSLLTLRSLVLILVSGHLTSIPS